MAILQSTTLSSTRALHLHVLAYVLAILVALPPPKVDSPRVSWPNAAGPLWRRPETAFIMTDGKALDTPILLIKKRVRTPEQCGLHLFEKELECTPCVSGAFSYLFGQSTMILDNP